MVVIAVFAIIYLPTISSTVNAYTKSTNLFIPVTPHGSGNPTYDDLRAYGYQYTGVDDYHTNIYVTFNTTNVEIGSSVQFQVKVEDPDGRLVKPYFYGFIVNNTDGVVSSFPQDTYLSGSGKPADSFINTYDNFVVQIKGDTYAMSRNALITGEGECWKNNQLVGTREIWFSKQIQVDPGLIGRWQIWIFVYDEQYKTVDGQALSSNNALTYTTEFFDVTSKKEPSSAGGYEQDLWWASSAITLLVSAYGMFGKVSPWLNAHSKEISSWFQRNRTVIVLLILVVIVNIILLFLNVTAPR